MRRRPTSVPVEPALAALHGRLRAVAPILAPGLETAAAPPGELLELLVAAVLEDPRPDTVWLLYIALTTVFPDADAVRRVLRGLRRRPEPGAATRWLLSVSLADSQALGDLGAELTVLQGAVLVDVDFTARNDLHTGVQRVVRGLLPRWHTGHRIVPVGWTRQHAALCELAEHERARVLRWSGDPFASGPVQLRPVHPPLVVPWRSVVVLAEVAAQPATARIAALAELSGNAVVAIGYDCIPVVSAQLLPRSEPERFTRYLAAVKFARRVAGISQTAAAEFGGFTAMLPGQGLTGPEVSAVPLPIEMPAPTSAPAADDGEPMVLCVGTLDRRKNPLALLYAAERLWREGLVFRLQFVVGGGPRDEAARKVSELAAAGRRVAVARGISESELQSLYRSARFSVFASLHEGYGLPVAESLAHGLPAIATSYGATAEIAAGGGVLGVDPRDDEALVAAMRLLLTDEAELDRLRAEIGSRPRRSWDDYATELWDVLVAPELPA